MRRDAAQNPNEEFAERIRPEQRRLRRIVRWLLAGIALIACYAVGNNLYGQYRVLRYVRAHRPQPLPPDDPGCPHGTAKIPAGRLRDRFAGEERTLQIASFCLDRNEVTVADYKRCVEQHLCFEPSDKDAYCNYASSREEHPVNCVRFSEAEKFCKREGRRLPTKFEWQYAAAHGEQQNPYPTGNHPSTREEACFRDRPGQEGVVAPVTCPVRSFPGESFGLFDLAGNVEEFARCETCLILPAGLPEYASPLMPSQSASEVVVGTSYSNAGNAGDERCEVYGFYETESPWAGFRCAADLVGER
jgi:formylglycine-generating enzyme required for sulfatase activity